MSRWTDQAYLSIGAGVLGSICSMYAYMYCDGHRSNPASGWMIQRDGKLDRHAVERVLNEVDKDGSGNIDLNEFAAAVRHYMNDNPTTPASVTYDPRYESKESAQRRLDLIAESRLRRFNQQVRATWNALDASHDQVVSRSELQNFMIRANSAMAEDVRRAQAIGGIGVCLLGTAGALVLSAVGRPGKHS